MADRPTEIKLVADLLEHPAESVEALAKAVIRELDADRALRRDHYVVRVNMAGYTFGLGPFDTYNQALDAARLMHPEGEDEELKRSISRLLPTRILAEVAPRVGGYCKECGHPNLSHDWPKLKVTGCVIGYQPGKPEAGCQCGRKATAVAV